MLSWASSCLAAVFLPSHLHPGQRCLFWQCDRGLVPACLDTSGRDPTTHDRSSSNVHPRCGQCLPPLRPLAQRCVSSWVCVLVALGLLSQSSSWRWPLPLNEAACKLQGNVTWGRCVPVSFPQDRWTSWALMGYSNLQTLFCVLVFTDAEISWLWSKVFCVPMSCYYYYYHLIICSEKSTF